MKRMHVHVAVNDLQQSITFYSALFAAQPTVLKSDYAKWMLDDPRVNFAISARDRQAGLDHLGIQVEDKDELNEVYTRLRCHCVPSITRACKENCEKSAEWKTRLQKRPSRHDTTVHSPFMPNEQT
jgi:catechol-2,3-dioxygenase